MRCQPPAGRTAEPPWRRTEDTSGDQVTARESKPMRLGSAVAQPYQQPSGIMVTTGIQSTSTGPPAAAQAAKAVAKADHGVTFHDLLSAMNPLQYLPVVGTIYRAVTGDVIPEALRRAGSFVVSGLLGGPIGLAASIVATLAEKITGIDPETIAAAQFKTKPPAAAAHVVLPEIAPAGTPTVQSAMTPRQLAAYGVRSDAAGTLKLGDITGADVLNTIQLARLDKAAAAYAATQTKSFAAVNAAPGSG